jgi:pilus assembly protein Flp/PilA
MELQDRRFTPVRAGRPALLRAIAPLRSGGTARVKPSKCVMALAAAIAEPKGMRLFSHIRHAAIWAAARTRISSERGASAVEYGIMVMLIAAVIIVAVVFLGNETSGTFSCTGESLDIQNEAC